MWRGSMLFNSLEFWIFFPIVVGVYFIIPKRIRYIWLLVTSYYFYMNWNAKYAILLMISTVITYVGGILIGRTQNENNNWKKGILAGCITGNLFILTIFKYADFFIENVNTLMVKAGLQTNIKPLHILLPVGISFYTFQAIGYVIDVYRGETKPEKNFLRYALFVSFFPQLVAGPIERSKNLLHQLKEVPIQKQFDMERIARGLILMIYGMFLKMVIADRAAIIPDAVFTDYYVYGAVELILAVFLFAIQIYCDFWSYSLIAMGAAKVMGFSLMENFNTPFFANSIRDLWKRWHISLSSWFRDYLYFPLGGSRCKKIRKYMNLMIVFLVSGLWHGAEWHFIFWGGLLGIFIIVGDMIAPMKKKLGDLCKVNRECDSYHLLQMAVTFLLFLISLIFFRADSVSAAIDILKKIVLEFNPWILFNGGLYNLGLDRIETHILVAAMTVLFLADLVRYKKNVLLDEYLMQQNFWFRWLVVILLVCAILIYGQYGTGFDEQQFIYFQF